MRNRPTVPRRTFLATAGAVTVTAMAGCQGDSDGEGENTTAGEDEGSTAAPTEEDGENGTATAPSDPQGEMVHSETITDTTEWEYDLEEGDTITVVGSTEEDRSRITASINSEETINLERIDNVGEASMQHTAEQGGTYRVRAGTGGTLTVEIYIAR